MFKTMVLYLMIPDIDDAEGDLESEHIDEDPDFDDCNFYLLLLYNSLSSLYFSFTAINIYYSMGGSIIWLDITRVGGTVFSRAAGE